ncbi:hypothetical protein BJX76DRAFT_357640 [Aspergillus varians]
MAENARRNATEDADATPATATPTMKRKPPKLRQKPPPEAAPEDSGDVGNGDSRDETDSNARDGDTTRNELPAKSEGQNEDRRQNGNHRSIEEMESEEPESESNLESPPTEEIGPPSPSPSPSPLPERELPKPKRSRPRRTMTLEREGEALPEPRRRNKGRQSVQQLVQLDDIGQTTNQVGEVARDVGGKAVGEIGNTAGQALGGVVGKQEEGKGKDEQLRLRLDLNLDIEVQLKAKIHGDLTLQLLWVFLRSLLVDFLTDMVRI